jgi:hypothetical protein
LRQLRIGACALVLAFSGAIVVQAQCPSPDNNPPSSDNIPNVILGRPDAATKEPPPDKEPLLPEAGFLSSTHYTSQFFGFGFDLPLSVEGHQIMLPVMPPKQHALLALQYEKGDHHGSIMVTATDPRPGFDANIPEKQQEQLQSWAEAGNSLPGQNQIAVPSFMLRSNHFHSAVHHYGHDYAAQYWTGIDNYMVKVMIITSDQDFLRKARNLMGQAQFYCPLEDGTLVSKDGTPVKLEGEPYYGPTVPTFRVNAALHDEPGKNIPPGEVAEGAYRNPELGLTYELPQGWEVAKEQSDPPIEASSLRVYQFLHACSRTLLQIEPQPAAKGKEQASGASIVLRALDPNCLSMRTATSLTDKQTTDAVAASLEELGEFGQIASDQLESLHGHLFMIFHGTLPASGPTQQLGQRLSQEILLTRYNKMLLMWSLLAPNADSLTALPASKIVFDGSPPIELRAALDAKK